MRYLVITAVLTVAVIGGARVFFGRAFHQEYTKDKVLAGMHLLQQPRAGGGAPAPHRAGAGRPAGDAARGWTSFAAAAC